MKHLSVILLMASLLLVSCKDNPKNYAAEIEDAVRFQLAVASSIALCEDGDDFRGMYTWMMDVANQEGIREGTFRDMLLEKSSDSFTAKILESYDSMDIVLSELQATQNERMWSFTELNTGIRFTFELIPVQGGEMYYRCSADEEDIRQLTIKSLQKAFWNALDISL